MRELWHKSSIELSHPLSIPDDVALVGFDGLSVARFATPPITTAVQPLADIGRESVLTLLKRIEDNSLPPIQKTLPINLELRQSTNKKIN